LKGALAYRYLLGASMNKRILVVAVLCVCAMVLIAHSLVWNFVTDDAFISFVYSRNLAEAGQLVFNLGERVEGYTNFLWTVLLAGWLKVGLQPELMSRVLGTAFGIGSLFVCARLVRREEDSFWDAVPALFLAASPGYACWSSGGLETQMFTFFVTLGVTRYLRRHLRDESPDAWVGLWFGLAALTRPEGMLFFALTGAHRFVVWVTKRQLPSRSDLVAGAVFLALVVPHALWRHHYYGWWLPNTFYIKASGGAGTWGQGGYYLYRMSEALHAAPAILLAILGLVLARGDRHLRAIAIYTLFVTTIFYLYIASVGGDFMGLFRFALPVLPLLFSAAALSLRAVAEKISTKPATGVVLAGVLFFAHAAHAVPVTKRAQTIGADRGIDTPGFLRWYTADRAVIGKWFGAHRQEGDFAAVGGAGAQVYYSHMPSLDCFGLSDSYIAHNVKAVSNRPGHQKYAPLEYELSRKPTILTSNHYRIAAVPYHAAPGEAEDWRRRGYRYVSVLMPGLSSPYYSFLLRNDRGIADIPPIVPERSP
jgi:hypothetical protein